MLVPPQLLQWFAGLEELQQQDYQRQEWLLKQEFTTQRLPELLPLSQQHCLYSLWFQCILADLLQGKLADRNGNIVGYAQELYDIYTKDSVRFAVDGRHIDVLVNPSGICITDEVIIRLQNIKKI